MNQPDTPSTLRQKSIISASYYCLRRHYVRPHTLIAHAFPLLWATNRVLDNVPQMISRFTEGHSERLVFSYDSCACHGMSTCNLCMQKMR